MILMNGDTMDGRMNQKYLFCFRPPLCCCVRVLRVRFIALRLRRRDTLHRASIGYTVDRRRIAKKRTTLMRIKGMVCLTLDSDTYRESFTGRAIAFFPTLSGLIPSLDPFFIVIDTSRLSCD